MLLIQYQILPVPLIIGSNGVNHCEYCNNGAGGDDDDADALPAHSHHDKNPPWWEFVSNEYGGNMPVTKSHH